VELRAPRARVRQTVASPPAAVFAFLADLRNHWRIASGLVTIAELDGGSDADGSRIELHGPLGLTRVAATRIARATEPAEGVGGVIEGTAETPGGTLVRIAWNLSPAPRGTQVTLELVVERASPADRLLLALGARRWLERRLLRRALADLEQSVAPQRR
jgi:hypothetical protein